MRIYMLLLDTSKTLKKILDQIFCFSILELLVLGGLGSSSSLVRRKEMKGLVFSTGIETHT